MLPEASQSTAKRLRRSAISRSAGSASFLDSGRTAALFGAMRGWKRISVRDSPPTSSTVYADESSTSMQRSTPIDVSITYGV
jgi:hypothetical protein